MKFGTAKEALEWFVKARETLGDPLSSFDNMCKQAGNHRPSVPLASLAAMESEPWIQVIPVHPSGNTPIGYVTDDQVIAMVDIEKMLSILSKWKREVLVRYATHGIESAIRLSREEAANRACADDDVSFFWRAVEHFESLLEEHDYLGSSCDNGRFVPALSERVYN